MNLKKFDTNKFLRRAGLLGALVLIFVFLVPMFSHGKLYKKKNQLGVVYWHGDETKKKVALTFDDGPNEPYTSEILEILKQYNVRATFFLIGKNVDLFPETAKALVTANEEIGNHSYSHPNLIFKTDSHVRLEILKAEEAIDSATGVKPKLFRPPFGGEDPLTILQTKKLGYVVVKWSVSARDWERPGVDKILSNVLKNVRNGSIILMHDGDKVNHGGDRSQTVKALPILIQELQKQGFELVTVSDILGIQEDHF